MSSRTTPVVQPTALGGLRQYDSQAPINSDVIKTSPGEFRQAMAANQGASLLYVMFFDAVAVPTNGSVPAFVPIPLAAGAACAIPFGPAMSNGLCWAASTTAATLTVDTTDSMWLSVQYR